MSPHATADIAIVGGGPAGAALAIALADAGRDVVLFERQPTPRWRAGGVYSSPRTWQALADLGLADAAIGALVRPIRTMLVRTTTGAGCSLEHAPPYACGIDRVRLERTLLDRAAAAGARVLEGVAVLDVRLTDRGTAEITVSAGAADADDGDPTGASTGADDARGSHPREWHVRTVVGADGPRSLVARAAGVDATHRRYLRAGLTVHHADPAAAAPGIPADASMTIGPGWYCGVAPVPGDRVNVGVVLGANELGAAASRGERPQDLLRLIVDRLPGSGEPWRSAPQTDALAVALPLAHRPRRLAGPGWLLVGDAAGFIDPLSGEGLGRAFGSAARAARALIAPGDRDAALTAYHRSMRARYRSKDLVSWLLQAFLARPEIAGYALERMARRPRLARTFNAVLTDLAPATRALDPRFLAALLVP